MKKTQLGATILEGSDVADLPLVSRNAQILEDEILKDRSKLEDKVDKEAGKGLSSNDFTKELKNKLETDIPNDITELKNELKTKPNTEDLSRSSTIVIANHDSHDNSKKTADIVIREGENAATKINKVIQSLKVTGGEVKLMEGNYQLDSKISALVDNITLAGVGKATRLIARNLPSGSRGSLVEVGEDSNTSNKQVKGFTISNLVVDGNNSTGIYRGLGLWGVVDANITNVECRNNTENGIGLYGDTSANIANVECIGNVANGIQLSNNSTANITNAECHDNAFSGFGLFSDSSANITNARCSGNTLNGIGLSNNSSATIANVECIGNKVDGISLYGESSTNITDVECSGNTKAGVSITSSSSEICISNSKMKDNRLNPEYVNQAQLEIGYHADNNAKHIFVTNCKIIDTSGNTRGVSIRGDNHVFINNQFIGDFKEKINDSSNNSTVRDNVGV